MLFDSLPPEVARRWDSDCSGLRLLIGMGTATVLGACLYGASLLGPQKLDTDSFFPLFTIQALILLGYGTSRVIASISEEKKSGTWDLQRLTPLSATRLASGKLLGAPLYAVCLTVALLPWALLSLFSSRAVTFGDAASDYILLLAGVWLCWTLGLAVSAYADERHGVGDGAKILVGLGMYLVLASTFSHSKKSDYTIVFYGLAAAPWLFYSASMFAFGFWAFESARLRIAADKLVQARSWRLPVFCAFLMWYELGLPASLTSPSAITILPLVAVLLSTMAEPWGLQEWRAWNARPAAERIEFAPAWLSGLAAGTVLAGIATAACLRAVNPEAILEARFPLLLLAFMTRDVLFLQWCRLRARRRPEILAVIYIALAYGLPLIMTLILRVQGYSYLFSASTEKNIHFITNLLPGLAQALGMSALLAYAATAALRRGGSGSAASSPTY